MTKCIKDNTKDGIKQENNNEKEKWHFESRSPTARFHAIVRFQYITYTSSSADTVRKDGNKTLGQGRTVQAFGDIKFIPEENIRDDAVDIYNDNSK